MSYDLGEITELPETTVRVRWGFVILSLFAIDPAHLSLFRHEPSAETQERQFPQAVETGPQETGLGVKKC